MAGVILWIGLCESSFSVLGYSVELLIEYSRTRLVPDVAINYGVVQNKEIDRSSLKVRL